MKKNVEEIVTKEDVKQETEENIRRVDNRPGSIFSIVIFAMVFLIGYLLYPQISLLLPIPGNEVTLSSNYKSTSLYQMLDAETVVIAVVSDKGKTKSYVSGNEPVVFKQVDFKVAEVLKGQTVSAITLPEYGGSALFEANGKKEKFTVTYENAAQFEKDKTYLLFISNGEVLNGKAGAIKQSDDGTFTDVSGEKYSIDDVKAYLMGDAS